MALTKDDYYVICQALETEIERLTRWSIENDGLSDNLHKSFSEQADNAQRLLISLIPRLGHSDRQYFSRWETYI